MISESDEEEKKKSDTSLDYVFLHMYVKCD